MNIRTLQRTALSVAVTAALGMTAEIAVAADALEEVVVTGLRRESTLRDAPVAVNVFNEETIRDGQIERPTDIVALTPGVTMVQSNIPGEAYITIRGNTQTRLGESSAAPVIDGVQSIDQNAINQE
ncbi:MAG: TonB-dependent receptor plug domain-containing protein, partial [Gammaproteobacteria bacterium]|nr:TonB-dependent receptor plug domain-containing protein [Gammaproteobacteria bacterium]